MTFGAKWTESGSGRLLADAAGRTPLTADVSPGGQASATMVMDVPRDLPPGDYVLKVDLVDELVCWFSDIPPNRPSDHRIRILA